MDQYLSRLIDDRNRELWNRLSTSNDISLAISDEPNFITNFKEGKTTIYLDLNCLSSSAFTHELLHIYIKENGIKIVDDLNAALLANDQIFYIFTLPLRDHMGNCLEHNKMLPLFLDLGYENHAFLSDFNKKKMDDQRMNNIEKFYRENRILNKDAIGDFIGNFFGMKACNNQYYNYGRFYQSLKRVDSILFTLLSDFWSDWDSFDIDDKTDNYKDIIDLYINDLESWCENKLIV